MPVFFPQTKNLWSSSLYTGVFALQVKATLSRVALDRDHNYNFDMHSEITVKLRK